MRAERYTVKALGYACASYVSSVHVPQQAPGRRQHAHHGSNTIQPFARVGSNVIVWAAITSDTTPSSRTTVSSSHLSCPGIRASILLPRRECHLRNGLTIAPETLIGAGAVVLNDTVERGVYLPMRARMSDKKSDDVEI